MSQSILYELDEDLSLFLLSEVISPEDFNADCDEICMDSFNDVRMNYAALEKHAFEELERIESGKRNYDPKNIDTELLKVLCFSDRKEYLVDLFDKLKIKPDLVQTTVSLESICKAVLQFKKSSGMSNKRTKGIFSHSCTIVYLQYVFKTEEALGKTVIEYNGQKNVTQTKVFLDQKQKELNRRKPGAKPKQKDELDKIIHGSSGAFIIRNARKLMHRNNSGDYNFSPIANAIKYFAELADSYESKNKLLKSLYPLFQVIFPLEELINEDEYDSTRHGYDNFNRYMLGHVKTILSIR